MSGGYFDYAQSYIGYIADEIAQIVADNDDTTPDEYGNPVGRGYSAETIARLVEAERVLRIAHVYAQRADWLLSGDDGEEAFHRRLAAELAAVGAGEGRG